MIPYIFHVFTKSVGFICGLRAAELMEFPQSSGADPKPSLDRQSDVKRSIRSP
jgi:hypothetical protein